MKCDVELKGRLLAKGTVKFKKSQRFTSNAIFKCISSLFLKRDAHISTTQLGLKTRGDHSLEHAYLFLVTKIVGKGAFFQPRERVTETPTADPQDSSARYPHPA
jgi:hypothetical protein